MRINLTGNSIGQSDAKTFLREDVAALFPITGKTIAGLCGENENLFMFPYSIETSDDMTGESSIMNILNTDDPDGVRITMGSIIGFIDVDSLRAEIKSRLDKDRGDYLLHCVLQKALSFNLFDPSHNNKEEDVFDFIMFMFPYFLKVAMRQDVYGEYQNFSYNDTDLKGIIDITRHITKNMPFVGNIACSTREYNHDNNVTELIRHIIEFMKAKRYGQSVLNADHETTENVEAIAEYTSSYNEDEWGCIINRDLRVKAHPHFTKCRSLQMLYLQIFRMDEVGHGKSNDDVCDILFDGAWPWEEYVNTVLRDYGFKHPENELHKGGIYLFDDHSGIRYPDFYKDDIVFDAKYKLLGSYDKMSEANSGDIHQVAAYMMALKVDQDGFVAPLNQK